MRRKVLLRFLAGPTIALALSACGDSSSATSGPTSPAVPRPPERTVFTLKQRASSALPPNGGELRMELGDITRGRVEISVRAENQLLAGPEKLKKDQSLVFFHGGKEYQLRVTSLSNALIGEDFAEFELTSGQEHQPDPATAAASEKQKIDQLLARMESLEGAAFIRNGDAHNARKAADHLRSKWKSAGDKITTAREFIDHLATASSLSGEPYRIRMADGTEMPSADFLNGVLKELESTP